MAPEKVTEMILNVDLKCSGCYKKVKKVICKIPQIRDQLFDVDKNKVKIIVVCCSPEKIRDKLCYKGGGAIQSIEIIEKPQEPVKPPGPGKPPPTGKPPGPEAGKPPGPEAVKPPGDKPKPPGDKPKPPGDKPNNPEKPKPPGDKPKPSGDKPKPPGDKPPPPGDKPKPPGDKPKEPEKAKPVDKPKEAPNADVAKMVYEPVHGYPHMYPPSGYPMMGYGPYYDQGYGGAPFQHGYGMTIAPPPPPPSYGGFGYENGYNGYNGNRSHYMGNEYGGHEEDGGCSIM